MKTVSAKVIKDRLDLDIEQQLREKMTLDKLCSFLHRVAEIGVRQRNIGLDGRVPVEDLIRHAFRHPENIAKKFIGQHTADFLLDGCDLILFGGFYWSAEGKRCGAIQLDGTSARANFPNFSKEVDELIAAFFPTRP